jgi:NOL1/NOP2/fmu family ribosome biogenesis protein
MKIELLNNSKKKKLIEQIDRNYGIEDLSQLVIQTGKGKFRIYSGSLSKEELNLLGKSINIEIIGSKLCKVDDEKVRMDFDILNLPEIKNQIKEFSTIHLPDEDLEHWLKGGDLNKNEEGFSYYIIKNKEDILGSGQNAKDHIKNYVPKERRIKSN